MERLAWLGLLGCGLVATGCGGSTSVATPNAAYTLVVTQEPNDTVPASDSLGTLEVEIRDVSGRAADIAALVRVTLLGADPNAVLAGTTEVAATAGRATFTDLAVRTAGAYTLTFQAEALEAKKAVIGLIVEAGPATQLRFVNQPQTTLPNTTVSPAIVVEFADLYGNRVDTAAPTTLAVGQNPSSRASLTGVTTVPSQAGVATFDQMTVSAAMTGRADGFTLRATANPNLTAESAEFALIASSWRIASTAPDPSRNAFTALPDVGAQKGALVWAADGNNHVSITGGGSWTMRPSPASLGAFFVGAPPLGGGVSLFARGLAGDANIFISLDNGSTFSAFATGYTLLAADPNQRNRVLASAGGALYAVTTGGVASQILGTTPRLLAAGHGSPTSLFAYTADGFYTSRNGGVTWVLLPLPAPNASYRQVVADLKNIGTVYVSTSAGLYKSTDFASSWTLLRSNCPTLVVLTPNGSTARPTQPTIYLTEGSACGAPTALLASPDGGQTWESASWGLGASLRGVTLVGDPSAQQTLYAVGQDGNLWRTDVGGLAAGR